MTEQPRCPFCGFELSIRPMECQFHHERGLTREAACWSCGRCFGLSRDDTLDRLPLPWNADTVQHQPGAAQ